MKTIKNDYCIRMFVGHDNLRPALNNVSLKENYLYATNRYVAAKIMGNLCVKTYEQIEKYPNAERVFQDHNSIEKTKVSVDSLFSDLMRIECCFKSKMVKCKNCGGDGEVMCNSCYHEHDCDECNGDGEVKDDNAIELTGEYACKLFNKNYKLHFIDLIIRTAIYTNVNEIEISNDKELAGTLFQVGDFDIILMPTSIT